MKRLIILILIVFSAGADRAIGGGPPYSRFGIGDLIRFASNRAYAMGVMGVALTGDGHINFHNPAALSRLAYTRIAGGFEYRNSGMEDASGTQRFATGAFQSLALAVPASTTHGIILIAGTRPTSTVNYDVTVTGPVGGSNATQTVSGSGGLSQLFVGASYRPTEDLSLGFLYEYNYGTITQRLGVDFDDGSFADNELRKSLFHRGSGFKAGLTFEGFDDLFGNPSLKPWSFGLTLTTATDLSVKEERILLTQNTADTSLVRRGSGTLPFAWSAGLAYMGESIVVAADAGIEQWGAANFFNPPIVDIRNDIRAGIGIELPPKQNPVGYWDRVAYRAGFTYTASYISMNGQPVNGWAVSGGIGLPIGPDARMNLGLQFGNRGTTDGGLVKESFFRLSLSLDAGEAWFITIEED